jgi:hypothetical protein
MPRQYMNLADIYGQVDAARANQANMENNRMLQERQRRQFSREDEQYADERAIKDIYRGAVTDVDGKPVLDEKRLISDLYQRAPEKALAVQEGFTKRDAEASKLQRENQKAELANKVETLKIARDVLSTAYDQPSYDAAMQQLTSIAPDLVKTAPRQFDTKFRDHSIMTADNFMKKAENELNRDVQMRGQDITMRGQNISQETAIRGQNISASTARRGQDITQRGQDLTNARGMEANAISKAKAPNEKLTEGMRSTGQYAARMTAAEKLLEGTTDQKPGLIEKGVGVLGETAANVARSPDRQKALQAQRDWVRAKLRKESGAAIGVDEMNNEILTYFPQIGDSKAVIAQKKQAREQAVSGMIDASGGAYNAPKTTGVDVRSEADKILGL